MLVYQRVTMKQRINFNVIHRRVQKFGSDPQKYTKVSFGWKTVIKLYLIVGYTVIAFWFPYTSQFQIPHPKSHGIHPNSQNSSHYPELPTWKSHWYPTWYQIPLKNNDIPIKTPLKLTYNLSHQKIHWTSHKSHIKISYLKSQEEKSI